MCFMCFESVLVAMSLQQAKRENRFLFSFWRFELNIIDSMVVPISTNQACEISVVSNLVVKKRQTFPKHSSLSTFFCWVKRVSLLASNSGIHWPLATLLHKIVHLSVEVSNKGQSKKQKNNNTPNPQVQVTCSWIQSSTVGWCRCRTQVYSLGNVSKGASSLKWNWAERMQ